MKLVFLLMLMILPPANLVAGEAWATFFSWAEAGKMKEAAQLVPSLSKGKPKTRIYLNAQLAFYRQDYAESLRLLKELTKEGKVPSRIAQFQTLVGNTHERTKGFATWETDHFTMRYQPGPDALLPLYAGEALELAWERIGHDLGEHPSTKMVVEFYPRGKDFVAVSTLTEKEVKTSGTVALCKFNRMMVTTPRALLRGYAWLDTVAHEYAHFVINRVTDSRTPVWLHEGVAKYEEVRWRKKTGSDLPHQSKALLARRLREGRLIPFSRMHPSIAKLDSAEDAALAFAQVYFFVRYLVEEKGTPASLRQLLLHLKQEKTAEEAIALVYGKSFELFYEDWKSWLGTLALPLDAPVQIRPLDFKLKVNSAKETEAAEIEKIGNHRARDLIRIGDLLLERKRGQAALIEYEKAVQALDQPSAFLLNKISYVAMEMGKKNRAMGALHKAVELAPDYAPSWVRRGILHLKAKQYDLAEHDFLQANAINPFDPEIHLGLQVIYKKSRAKEKLRREERAQRALISAHGREDRP